jgi:hypothetical protein
MWRPALLVVASLLIAVAAAPAWAGEADEASIEILRDSLRTNKKAFVAVNLTLSDAEAKPFCRSTTATRRSSARSRTGWRA